MSRRTPLRLALCGRSSSLSLSAESSNGSRFGHNSTSLVCIQPNNPRYNTSARVCACTYTRKTRTHAHALTRTHTWPNVTGAPASTAEPDTGTLPVIGSKDLVVFRSSSSLHTVNQSTLTNGNSANSTVEIKVLRAFLTCRHIDGYFLMESVVCL